MKWQTASTRRLTASSLMSSRSNSTSSAMTFNPWSPTLKRSLLTSPALPLCSLNPRGPSAAWLLARSCFPLRPNRLQRSLRSAPASTAAAMPSNGSQVPARITANPSPLTSVRNVASGSRRPDDDSLQLHLPQMPALYPVRGR